MCVRQDKNGALLLDVYVQPKSSSDRPSGLHGDALKVCVTAPPSDGKANEAVIRLIASLLNIPKSAIAVKSGAQSRKKRLLLHNISLQEAEKKLCVLRKKE